jgi:hypothetical protein
MHPFAERIPQDSEFRVMAESAFGAVDAFRGKIRDIKSNKKLSDQGHLDEIRSAALAGPLTYFKALRQQIGSERKSLAERRSHFEIPAPRSDNLFAEMRAQEIRTWLRTLPIGERIKHAASDPEIAAAVVHTPPALAGLTEDGHERAKAFLLEHLHGPELATLRQESEIVDTVGTAIDIAEKQLLNEFEPTQTKEMTSG